MLPGCLADYSRRGGGVTAHARSLGVSERMRKGSRSCDVSVAPGCCEGGGRYARNVIGSAVPMAPLLSLNHSLCTIDSQ